MKKRTMAVVPTNGTFLSPEEIDNLSQAVEKEILTDPALQAIYIARRIMRREAEEIGLDYPSYLTPLGEKKMAESKANQ